MCVVGKHPVFRIIHGDNTVNVLPFTVGIWKGSQLGTPIVTRIQTSIETYGWVSLPKEMKGLLSLWDVSILTVKLVSPQFVCKLYTHTNAGCCPHGLYPNRCSCHWHILIKVTWAARHPLLLWPSMKRFSLFRTRKNRMLQSWRCSPW